MKWAASIGATCSPVRVRDVNREPSPTEPFAEVTYEQWRARVREQLGPGADLDQTLRRHAEGLDLEPLYTAKYPGAVDAIDLSSVRTGGWRIVQNHTGALAAETLKDAIREDLDHGVEGVVLDWSESTAASKALEGYVADLEVLVLRVADLTGTFESDLGAWIDEVGLDLGSQTLLVDADPLARMASVSSFNGALESVNDRLTSLARWSGHEDPGIRSLMISTVPYREAGAEIDLEIGIALAAATQYLRGAEAEQVPLERAGGAMACITSTGQQIFLEVAKLRALRLAWGALCEACGLVEKPELWIHATVLARSLSREDPWDNLMRITTSAWAAAVGGVDSLETPPFLQADSEAERQRGARLARNTQLLLRDEAHLGKVVDPGSGSYVLERWTRSYAELGWERFREIERQGGLASALCSGWLQETLDQRAGEGQ